MLGIAWNILRITLLATMTVLAPVARVGLGALSLLSLLIAGIYSLELPYRAFPVMGMLGVALGLALLLILYQLILRSLSE